MDTKTHRCIDCPLEVEHLESELCPSCGRCAKHCVGVKDTSTFVASDWTSLAVIGGHALMKRIGEK